MPELPEVEITVRTLNALAPTPFKIERIQFNRKDIRNKIPIRAIQKIKNHVVLKIYRRAKFIVFELENGFFLSHLGMTGSWRKEKSATIQLRPHDHVLLHLTGGECLVFNDPRRFGEFDFINRDEMEKRFSKYGPEPLDVGLDWNLITAKFKKLNTSIKVALMNQKYLVGVGNIYANEALYLAGIRPQRKASAVSGYQYERLWKAIPRVLQQAIASGGSTIQDFRNSYGDQGQFQDSFKVYDRKGKPCSVCQRPIKAATLGGRATYWCSHCQK